MASEIFVASIRVQQRTANTAIPKDVGIYVQTLQPVHRVTSTFKKSSTLPNCMAVSSTHIFTAQVDKAVVHVYSRDRGNQEAIVSFPERIHSLALVHDGLLALGTAEGRIILWELCTGRQVITPSSHLQPVACIAATTQHLITGSEDANIHVWSIPKLLSMVSTDIHQPLRSLSNHRAGVTSIAIGHSASNIKICVSASKDITCVVWNYHTGELLRTFLLPSIPLCVVLDPCDRAIYTGFEDGSIQSIEIFQPRSSANSLHDGSLQNTPTQIPPNQFSGAPLEIGTTHCLCLSYDGTVLLSGHSSGKIVKWDAGPQKFSDELIDLNAPVTNLEILSPFPENIPFQAVAVVKPKFGGGNYSCTVQFTHSVSENGLEEALRSPGIPPDLLDAAVMEFHTAAVTNPLGDEKTRKENVELWGIVNEQRLLQKRTYEKYLEAKASL